MPLTLGPGTAPNTARTQRFRRRAGTGLLVATLLLTACGDGEEAAPREAEGSTTEATEAGTAASSEEAAEERAPAEDEGEDQAVASDADLTASFEGEAMSFDTVECSMRGAVFTVFGEGDDRAEFKFETAEDSEVAEMLEAIMLIPDHDDDLGDSQLQIYQAVDGVGSADLADLAEGGEAPQGSGTIELEGMPGTEADPDGGTLEFDFSC